MEVVMEADLATLPSKVVAEVDLVELVDIELVEVKDQVIQVNMVELV